MPPRSYLIEPMNTIVSNTIAKELSNQTDHRVQEKRLEMLLHLYMGNPPADFCVSMGKTVAAAKAERQAQDAASAGGLKQSASMPQLQQPRSPSAARAAAEPLPQKRPPTPTPGSPGNRAFQQTQTPKQLKCMLGGHGQQIASPSSPPGCGARPAPQGSANVRSRGQRRAGSTPALNQRQLLNGAPPRKPGARGGARGIPSAMQKKRA